MKKPFNSTNKTAAFSTAIFSAVLLAISSLTAAPVFAQDIDPEIQRQIVIAAPEWEYDLNPQTANYASEAQILTGLYEGLFSYNPLTVEPVPALCKSFKLSRDKKRWTFTLREDVKFSNGDPINAQAIRASWLSVLANKEAEFASMLDCIQGVAEYRAGLTDENGVKIFAKDDLTLVVHLVEPTEHLPQILCHHSFSAISEKENVYSGAYTLTKFTDTEIILEKNQLYWDAEHVYTPSIKYVISDDTKESTWLYNDGSVDWLSRDADVGCLLSQDDIQMFAEFGTEFYFFKTNGSVWDNVKFRRALIEAIPYDKLRDGFFIKAETLVYPLNGYPEVEGFDDYDTDDAIALMDAARESAGIPKDKKLSLTIAVAAGNKTEMGMATILKEAWAPLGVNVTIQNTPSSRYFASIPYSKADLFIFGWIGDYADPLAFLELFRSNSSLNCAKYSNAEYDQLLKQASETEDKTEHYKLLAAAEQILLDDAEIIPINHFVAFHVINTNLVGGWYQNALDIHPLKYLYIKPLKIELENLI